MFLFALCLATLLSVTDNTPSAPTRQPDRWTYEVVERAGKSVRKASLPATRLVPFDYPYAGGSVVTLTILQGSEGPVVSLDTPKGLFTRSFQNGSAHVRFDKEQPVRFTLLAAANGRANIVFFDDANQFVRRLKASKQVQIKLAFAGQRPREVHFATAGLRWSP